jgi:phosphonate transport system substrate-binding protein
VQLFKVYQPMIDAINQRAAGFSVKLETARDHPSYDARLHERKLDLALVNPYQAIVAERCGYRIFGKMADDDRFVGIIVARKGSGIRVPADLRGAPISFPAPTAFAATMMNQVFLKQHGLDVEKEAIPKYVGSQDSAVMNVFLGLTRAGGTWPPTWEAMKMDRPDVVQALEIKWQTPPLVNLGLVARREISAERVRGIAAVLFNLHRSGPGREMLQRMGTSRYVPATSASYDPVRRFLHEYRRQVRAEPMREAAR